MEVQNVGDDQDDQAESMDSMSASKDDVVGSPQHQEDSGDKEDLPRGVKERLGRAEKRHQKEMRALRSQLEAIQANSQHSNTDMPPPADPYGGNTPQAGSVEEHIHRAVNYALEHQKMQERKGKEAQEAAHVQRQYQELHKHLDNMSDKYEDFHEIVMGNEVPFTNSMRDASLLLPKKGAGSAGEVLYKLAKNHDELNRISRLHPLDQAAELVSLSHALMGGNESKNSMSPRPMGNIKSNPVTNSASVTDKTPVSELRKRMKSGWK